MAIQANGCVWQLGLRVAGHRPDWESDYRPRPNFLGGARRGSLATIFNGFQAFGVTVDIGECFVPIVECQR